MTAIAERIEAVMERYAPDGFDPASDDLTVPFALKLVEKDIEIERLRAALKPFAEVAKHYAPYPDDVTDVAVDYPFKLANLRAAAHALDHP